MLLVNILLVITTIFSAFLILFIIVSNPKKVLNRSLALFILFTFLWLFTNLITNLSSSEGMALFFGRTTVIFAALIPLAFLLFVRAFLSSSIQPKNFFILALMPLTIILFTYTKYNLASIESYGQNAVVGPLYVLMIFELVLYFSIGLWGLLSRYRSSNSQLEKKQIKYIFYGVIVALIPAVAINAILPVFSSNEEIILYGPNAVIFLAIFMTIAITKHRFLDIRLIVARALAYLLLLSALVAMYVAIIIVPSVYIIPQEESFLKNLVPFIAALFVAGSAPYLKKFFDRLTNKFFYRDAYEPQVFLDDLNKALVGEIETEKLLTTVTGIMEENLKSSYVAVGVKETDSKPLRIIGPNSPAYKEEEIAYVRSELISSGKRIIIAADLEQEKHKLQEIFRKNDIDIIVRLLTSYDTGQEAIAYLILGPKKSGNIYNKQDIQILGIIADELVIAIQNALRFEEIQEFAVTLQQKVDEATARLRRTNEKLKELDDTKDEFISMASHQLRTPLTSVKGYLSMVLEGDAGAIKPQQKQLLEQSFLSAQRMVYIIADLLNVSRLKTGKFVLDVNPTDITEMIKGEIDQLKEAFRAKKLTVEFDKPKEFPMLLLDETKTRQVIMNFIDNAIYYTPAGGRIDVSLTQDKKHTYFRVKDSGLGVPKSEQAHLFTKFYRATNARKARPDGTGLGLFMAKKVIVAQGGTILFESQEGKGSTFGFCFETAKLIPASTEKPQEAAKV